ncbi:hypothetical protein [Mucilaginibacter glaciei]|uniref:Uncharacterized protein n=1 Tax=Mucilaginibacter glaciei TaxID=2772109 RepID=A0A926NGD1_9SPHI|nr:hypothetical protein [Mucilaginibacter glaciei]MBD1391589.1 hypothetical protein [Mucilaginibacter glaciei]
MLAVLLFNMGGHLLLLQYMINKADNFANEQISKGYYKTEDLVEIKIPVRMPYVHEQRFYENVSGQIQLKGNCYNYVALKMTRDTMYVKCVPNYNKTKLINDNVITAKEVSDGPLSKKTHTPPVKKNGIDNEYNYTITLFDLAAPAGILHTSYIDKASRLSDIHLSALGQPPELLV